MKKTLQESQIINELRGQSAFFPKQAPPPPPSNAPQPSAPDVHPSLDKETNERINVPTNDQTIKRSSERTRSRRKIRHTFDIYHDQLLSLREIALQREVMFGERTLLGDLVQEALDMLIAKERNND